MRAHGMSAVTLIIAGNGESKTARIRTGVGMNAVMPVIIMIRRCAVPTAVMRFQRVMIQRYPVSPPATTMPGRCSQAQHRRVV